MILVISRQIKKYKTLTEKLFFLAKMILAIGRKKNEKIELFQNLFSFHTHTFQKKYQK